MNGELTKGGKRYFMTLIDDCTRFCYIYLLKSKDEALHYFKIYKGEVENQLERKIKHVRIDRGGEYFSNLFTLFCEEHGIHERTPPYSPQSNGVAERKNHTLTDLVNAMLDTSGLSKEWLGEAILTACHVLNQVPIKNKEITPFEEWEKKRENLLYLRTWGCLAKVNVPINKKCKLRPKIVDCIFHLCSSHRNYFNLPPAHNMKFPLLLLLFFQPCLSHPGMGSLILVQTHAPCPS
jgi:transposase InsO family protein